KRGTPSPCGRYSTSSASMPKPGSRPGSRGGMVTSGALGAGLLVDGEGLPSGLGGSSRSPVLPPIRPLSSLPADGLGPVLPGEWLSEEVSPPVLGRSADGPVPEASGDGVGLVVRRLSSSLSGAAGWG